MIDEAGPSSEGGNPIEGATSAKGQLRRPPKSKSSEPSLIRSSCSRQLFGNHLGDAEQFDRGRISGSEYCKSSKFDHC